MSYSASTICQKLWSTDTFVDFDHSLGTAINRIREVLNDSAAEPRFVETIPRRGYRFIASVTAVAVDPPSVAQEQVVPSPPPAELVKAPFRKRPSLSVVGVGIAFVLLAAAFVAWNFHNGRESLLSKRGRTHALPGRLYVIRPTRPVHTPAGLNF